MKAKVCFTQGYYDNHKDITGGGICFCDGEFDGKEFDPNGEELLMYGNAVKGDVQEGVRIELVNVVIQETPEDIPCCIAVCHDRTLRILKGKVQEKDLTPMEKDAYSEFKTLCSNRKGLVRVEMCESYCDEVDLALAAAEGAIDDFK